MNLEMKSITKSFGDKLVLKDIGLQAKSGSALGLLGRNGAGKTTSIRIIMGVFPPDSGEVLADGKPLSKSGISFGYLPEERGLYPKKLISDQLIYLAQLRGVKKSEAISSIKKWLARIDMLEYYDKKLDTLSKGNQQKIQLASVLIHDPDVIILDEPFSGLDPVNAQILKDVVQELVQSGKTVIFSSHQMQYVEEFCNHIAIINDGKIVLDGSLRDIKLSYPRNRIRIVLESGDADQIVRATLERAGLSGLIQGIHTNGSEAVITLADETKRAQAFSAFTAADMPLCQLEVVSPTLSEIFVEKTGDTL